jgi:ubiquinone/menaquinone biosynthesis C-methylase UbiE
MRNCELQSVVLDAGCGRAGYPIPWQDFCGSVIGVDLSPQVEENPWVEHKVRGDLYKLPFPDNSVDLAILRYVLEHLESPGEALREITRVLRPGGKVLLVTPNRRHYVCLIASLTPHWFHRWFLARHGRFDDDVCPTRYRANTPGRLREVASQSGFRLAELELFEAAPGYLEWSWPTFLMGVAYERTVKRFEALAGLRVSILATLEKIS